MKIVFGVLAGLTYLATMGQQQPVSPGVYKWADITLGADEERASRKILEGCSPHFEYLEIHATTQLKGAKASPQHTNEDVEECIIVREGTLKATVEGKTSILGPGSVILLMPQQVHTVENVGDGNLTYYVMRYRSKKKMDMQRGLASGGTLMVNADSLAFIPSARGGGKPYFDRPTAMCERFEMHVTRLDRIGASHAPHQHDETEIILVISGDTEMTIDGKDYSGSSGDFYFINSGLFHGIRNATNETCTYFAFKWK